MPFSDRNEYLAMPPGFRGIVIMPPPVNRLRASKLSRLTWIASTYFKVLQYRVPAVASGASYSVRISSAMLSASST